MAELEKDKGSFSQEAKIPTERAARLAHGLLTAASMIPLLTPGKSMLQHEGGIFPFRRVKNNGQIVVDAPVITPYDWPEHFTHLGEDIGDGWIAAPPGGWTENPVPGVGVWVKMDGGDIETEDTSDAFDWPWVHDGQGGDIIALRLANTPKHEDTDAMGMESQPIDHETEAFKVLQVIEQRAWALGDDQYARLAKEAKDHLSRATTQPAEQTALGIARLSLSRIYLGHASSPKETARLALDDMDRAAEQSASSPVEGAARFLLDRLTDFENRISTDEDGREFYGHVSPAAARLRAALEDKS